MANHVTTRCTVIGRASDVAAFQDRMIIKEDGRGDFGGENLPAEMLAAIASVREIMRTKQTEPLMRFDFEKIIPVPAIVRQIEESTASEQGARLIFLRGELGDPLETMGMAETSIEYFRADVDMPDAPIHEVAAAFLQNHPDYEAKGRLRLRALVEAGFAGWYSSTSSIGERRLTPTRSELLATTPWNFCLIRHGHFQCGFLRRSRANSLFFNSSV
jgi:hypothetical protein